MADDRGRKTEDSNLSLFGDYVSLRKTRHGILRCANCEALSLQITQEDRIEDEDAPGLGILKNKKGFR